VEPTVHPATEEPDPAPEFVAANDYVTGVIPLARPGVVVWLDDDAPDEDEVARANAMRAHPANVPAEEPEESHLRVVP
jgi:hypothetical protein